MAAGRIGKGTVERKRIETLDAGTFADFTRCHFFAGIGGWDYALDLAGWPPDVPVWTGSCPCQPFSVAGKRKGVSDDRHLWPDFRRLIETAHPATIFGEQVAGPDGLLWLSGVRQDLETLGYEVGAADLCAAGVSAPHIRQRLFWVAVSKSKQMGNFRQSRIQSGKGTNVGLVHPNGYHEHWWDCVMQMGGGTIQGEVERSGRKYRAEWRLKPGISILADGIPARMERCSAYGNAIVPQVAAEFIKAFMDWGQIGRHNDSLDR